MSPLHISDEYTSISGIEVQYIVPTNALSLDKGIKGITFNRYRYGARSKQNKLMWKVIDNDTFEVHRRIDNGVAGSGVIYLVDYASKQDKDITTLTFKPTKTKTYQQGFIGKRGFNS